MGLVERFITSRIATTTFLTSESRFRFLLKNSNIAYRHILSLRHTRRNNDVSDQELLFLPEFHFNTCHDPLGR